MPNLRVLVSSTAYDLGVLRTSLKNFIQSLGFDPVLSEESDVLYDPRDHTHGSCLREVEQCDMVILIIGARFGSSISDAEVQKLTARLDEAALERPTSTRLSVTQAEALTAAIHRIPVFAFVERGVDHDYRIYRRNVHEDFAANIQYASIARAGTAEYIFSFIEYLQRRASNNSITIFDSIDDVYGHLQKQWSALFQRLLRESRMQEEKEVRIDKLAQEMQELKEAVLQSIGPGGGGRTIARMSIEYRDMVDFLRCLPPAAAPIRDLVVEVTHSWDELLLIAGGITSLEELKDPSSPWPTLLRRGALEDHVCRISTADISKLGERWKRFRQLPSDQKAVVIDGLFEVLNSSPRVIAPVGGRAVGAARLWTDHPAQEITSREADFVEVSGPLGELGASDDE